MIDPKQAAIKRYGFNLTRISAEQKAESYAVIKKQSVISRSFIILAILSTIIASYGLLTNSTAVVIGAMLLAPLMGPIFGIALGLLLGEFRLFRQAVISEVCGVALVILFGVLIGLVPWHSAFGTEILSRTQPTLLDLFIALAAGLAGAYALLDERVSSSLTGVAIATALVPPLASCGLCLSAGRYQEAGGAFLLFLVNFLAIQIAGAIVFIIFRLNTVHHGPAMTLRLFLQRFSISLVVLLILAVFLSYTLRRLVLEERFSQSVQSILASELRSTTGAHLTEVSIKRTTSSIDIMAVVLTPLEFAPESVARIEQILRTQVDSKIHIIVRSLISKDADRKGQVFLSDEALTTNVRNHQEKALLTKISQEISLSLAKVPGARLIDLRHDAGKNNMVNAIVRSPIPIDPPQVAEFEKNLQTNVDPTLHLVIRSVLTKDANAQQYLYEISNAAPPLSDEALRWRQWIKSALGNQLAQHVPIASLQEFRATQHEESLVIFAVVRTPQSITPEQVSKIQAAFRKYVDPQSEIIIRSVVGVDTGAAGYLPSFDETGL